MYAPHRVNPVVTATWLKTMSASTRSSTSLATGVLKTTWPTRPLLPKPVKKWPIIGAGPAGLAAAYQLRLRGHGVTIFDEHEELGGMMRYGIPGFRTPREMLDSEIKRIIDLGVETRLKTRIGSDVSYEQIDKEFDAIFMAMGAQAGRPLPVPGAEAPELRDCSCIPARI